MPVLDVSNLRSTALFSQLVNLTNGESPLPGNVLQLCREAADRLKFFPAAHGQYTLHDEVHCLRVVVLMGELLGQNVNSINAVEIALLILSAYYHDQGMIVDAEEVEEIRASEEWQFHEAQWGREHPNKAELSARLADPLLDEAQKKEVVLALADLDAAAFTEFVRQRHGERSASFLRTHYGGDPRLNINGRNVVDLLARVCHSHVLPPAQLLDVSTYKYAELVGTEKVNISFLATVLRLADILDFDRDRTPDSLYRAISYTSQVSLAEWEKHRSVVGWEISPGRIAFTAECTHPAYQRAVQSFLGWVEEELRAVSEWNRRLPGEFHHYRLDLPTTVDANNVVPQSDPSTGQPRYMYFDLEFSLARDELVKLLMTSELYQSRGLFVRELLQNSLDALRHRSALFKVAGMIPPALSVELEHVQDSAGFDVIRCTDNGVGMDVSLITNFLTRAGRSYYRSPEFERERAHFRSVGCDFDPCARFGIGFMSCFMFGDDITIYTRRDYGQGKEWGPPLVVHITGLSGIVVIRPGSRTQPVGTQVEVRARRKSFIVDEHDDPVRLLEIVRGYALATEYPITAVNRIPALENTVSVPVTFSARPHPLEEAPITGKTTFTVDLSSVSENLAGEIRMCTLLDEQGRVAISTSEASIQQDTASRTSPRDFFAKLTDDSVINITRVHHRVQICADGILVAGEPGRVDREDWLAHYASPLHLGGASALIDVRGNVKPMLTPARTPPFDRVRREGSWVRLDALVGKAYGKMLQAIIERCEPGENPLRIWEAAAAYDLRLDLLPLRTAWDLLRFPVQQRGVVELQWLRLGDIPGGRLIFPDTVTESEEARLELDDDLAFATPPELKDYVRDRENGWPEYTMRSFLIASSVIQPESSTTLRLIPTPPADEEASLEDFKLGEWPFAMRSARIRHAELRILRAYGASGIANCEHPIVSRVKALYVRPREDYSPLEEFLSTIVWNWPQISSKDSDSNRTWSMRSRLKLAQLYQAIDWSAIAIDLRPPYSAFVAGRGIETVTHDDFIRWATTDR